MLKKIIKILLPIFCILFFLFSINTTFSEKTPCNYKVGDKIIDSLENCLNGTELVKSGNLDTSKSGGFKVFILKFVKIIGGFFGLLAVLAIVNGSIRLAVSTGDDEKIKKAKDIIKWGILGFLLIISASAIITVLIQSFYKLAGA